MLLFVQRKHNTSNKTLFQLHYRYSLLMLMLHQNEMIWMKRINSFTLLKPFNDSKTSICFKMPNAHSWIFFYPCSNVFLSKNINGLTFLFFKQILCLTSVDEVLKTLAELELHNQDSKLRITSGPPLRYHYTILKSSTYQHTSDQ